MMRLCLLVLFLSTTSIWSVAQSTETFDIATFQSPAGWKKQTKPGAVVYTTSNEQKGTFAIMTIYRSGESSGNAQRDFENDWQEFIAGQLEVKEKPQIEPLEKAGDWDLLAGGTPFQGSLGPSVVLMATYSGHGISFSCAAVFNSQDHLPAIEALFSSIELKKPEAVMRTAAANENSSASVLGTWGVSQSDQSAFRVNNAVMSYIKREYTFNADGSYRFISKAFDPFSTKLLFGKETGTYRVTNDLLTITPKTSVLEGWSKRGGSGDKWGNRLDSQNRKLETVTYRFTKHYFSGIQTTSLILIADKVTQRDGPFSGGTGFNNAWIYSPPCEKCFIELPR